MDAETSRWVLGLGVAAVSAMWLALVGGAATVFKWMQQQNDLDRAEREAWRGTIDRHTEESRQITNVLQRMSDKEEQEAELLHDLAKEVRGTH